MSTLLNTIKTYDPSLIAHVEGLIYRDEIDPNTDLRNHSTRVNLSFKGLKYLYKNVPEYTEEEISSNTFEDDIFNDFLLDTVAATFDDFTSDEVKSYKSENAYEMPSNEESALVPTNDEDHPIKLDVNEEITSLFEEKKDSQSNDENNKNLNDKINFNDLPLPMNYDAPYRIAMGDKILNQNWNFDIFTNTNLASRVQKHKNVGIGNMMDLLKRSTFLDRIDSLAEESDKASYKDILDLPRGWNVIAYGPSTGKTTAIRQFITKFYSIYKFIYATKTVSDCRRVYYDLMSKQLAGEIPENITISIIASDERTNYNRVKKADIIVCTHARLLIESPEVLKGNSKRYCPTMVFIDENPTLFSDINITPTMATFTNYVADKLNITYEDCLNPEKDVKSTIYKYIEELVGNNLYVDKDTKNKTSTSDRLDKQICELLEDSLADNKIYLVNADKYVASKRAAHFGTFMVLNILRIQNEIINSDQVKKSEKRSSSKRASTTRALRTKTLRYDVLSELNAEYVHIFDGTGDISYEGTTKFNIIRDDRFLRNLKLTKQIQVIPDTNLIWKVKTEDDFEADKEMLANIAGYIAQWIDDHPRESILVYGYGYIDVNIKERSNSTEDFERRCIIDDNNSFRLCIKECIESYLEEDQLNRFNYIHYQSGKEIGTSEFKHCSAIFILGDFHLPNYVWSEWKKYIQSTVDTTEFNNSIALMIQAVNRTNNRDFNSKGIELIMSEHFVDNKKGAKYLAKFLNRFDNIYLNDEPITDVKDILNDLMVKHEAIRQYTIKGVNHINSDKFDMKQFIASNWKNIKDGKIISIPDEIKNLTNFKRKLYRLLNNKENKGLYVCDYSPTKEEVAAEDKLRKGVSYRRNVRICCNTRSFSKSSDKMVMIYSSDTGYIA